MQKATGHSGKVSAEHYGKLDKQANGGGGNSPPVSAQLTVIKSEINLLWIKSARELQEIGRKLIRVKKLLGHGKWMPWVEKNCPFSGRSATNFMNLAKCATAANLSKSMTEILEDAGFAPKGKESRAGRTHPLPAASAGLKPFTCPHCGKEVVSAKGGAK